MMTTITQPILQNDLFAVQQINQAIICELAEQNPLRTIDLISNISWLSSYLFRSEVRYLLIDARSIHYTPKALFFQWLENILKGYLGGNNLRQIAIAIEQPLHIPNAPGIVRQLYQLGIEIIQVPHIEQALLWIDQQNNT